MFLVLTKTALLHDEQNVFRECDRTVREHQGQTTTASSNFHRAQSFTRY